MGAMTRRVVESSSGTGSLFSGGELQGRVPYALTVTEEIVALNEIGDSDGEKIFELRSGSGRLIMDEALLQIDSNHLLLKDWLLVLEDGRRVRILIELADTRTGACHFATRGNIER